MPNLPTRQLSQAERLAVSRCAAAAVAAAAAAAGLPLRVAAARNVPPPPRPVNGPGDRVYAPLYSCGLSMRAAARIEAVLRRLPPTVAAPRAAQPVRVRVTQVSRTRLDRG
jgi:hypothetical protein